MDKVFIEALAIDCVIGIYDWERKAPQTVQFDLEIGIPDRAKPVEKIGDTIDYTKVVARIESSLRGNHFPLVERLAEHVAQLVLQEFRSPWIRVSVTKLSPLRNVKRLGVTIERGAKT